MSIPTDQQLREAGVRLGFLADGDPVPPRLRAKLSKAVQMAQTDDAQQIAASVRSTDVAQQLTEINRRLLAGGVSDPNVGQVLAALAPHVWRTIEGATR